MFTIFKQIHPFGCIPACAASVMQYLRIEGKWSEGLIFHMYDVPAQLSGFDKLKYFLDTVGLPDGWQIHIAGNEVDFKQFILEKNFSDTPVLCPINQGPENNAHCVVVADSDKDNLVIYDPSPIMPDSRIENYESFQSKWAGSFLWFEKV